MASSSSPSSSSLSTGSSPYPYPLTVNPLSFVSIKLSNTENYKLWEAQLMCLIASHDLLGFIDGTTPAPPETIPSGAADDDDRGEMVVANEDYRLWKRSDWLVKGWILGSLVDHVLATVVGLPTATDVWKTLLDNLGPHPKEDQVAAAKPTRNIKDYPDLSMVKVENFISVKLTRFNFTIWRAQIFCLLLSQDVSSFFTRPVPPEYVSSPNDEKIFTEDFKLWKRLDFLLKGWILGSITEDLLWHVAFLDTSKEVLVKLEDIFITRDSLRFFFTKHRYHQQGQERRVKTFIDYPYPSTVNVANFIFFKLCRTNYNVWIKQIIRLVESHELESFIFSPEPSEVVSSPDDGNLNTLLKEDYKHWTRTDLLVKGWILGSITEDILPLVAHLRTSRDVLAKLEGIFLTNDKDRLFSENPITAEQGAQEAEAVVAARSAKTIKDYPDLSMVNVANFISIKLTRTNYMNWRMQIICLIRSQDLFSFIHSPRPSVTRSILDDDKSMKSEDYRLWSRLDYLLKGWILGSITEELLPLVTYANTSRDALAKLEDIFLANENFRVFHHYPPAAEQEAALAGDWETAKAFFDREIGAATAFITENYETALHVAVGTGKANHFVEKLVEILSEDALRMERISGETPLNVAARVGNTEAVKILMKKDPLLVYTKNKKGERPLHIAVSAGHRDTTAYLLSVSTDYDYPGEMAVDLLGITITAEYYDFALEFVKRYPHAAKLEGNRFKPLSLIAGKVSAFRSGMLLNSVESFIYSYVPVKFENHYNSQTSVHLRGVCRRLYLMLWDVMQVFVPHIKSIHHKKLVHLQAVHLVNCLCEGVKSSLDMTTYVKRTNEPVVTAASLGVFEVVEEIVHVLPYAIRSREESGYYIPQIAVISRCEKVFNLIYQMSGFQHDFISHRDNSMNSMLHLAGRLAPTHKLNLVSGAALQMQRELQWFEEVKKVVNPACKDMMNSSGETPAMVFTREHKELVKDGEKWMKDTANSCTIAAALIITVVFAAAITVPGGNDQNTGHPIFSKGIAFWLFAVSDAISLFTSTTSLLMFLSILTARYAEQDFLLALPKRLVLGLFTLFISITSMIMAFSTTAYLVFGENKGWIIIPLVALSSLPVTSFMTLQFPLLRDVFTSTYGRGIFGKQSDRPFH